MDANRIKEVFSDEAFVKSLLELENPAEVQAALKEKGIDLSESKIMEMRDQIAAHIENGTTPDELSLDQLDDVAGGLFITMTVTTMVTIAACTFLAAGGAAAAVTLIRRW